MSGGSRALVSAALFVVLGIVAAFLVSALADRDPNEPDDTGLRALEAGVEDRAAIRVEVLNGAGVGGLARDATHHLRGSGFDVVFFGNARRFDHARSVVIDRTGDPERARAVAAALGIDSVTTATDSSLMLEVTVVLGRDWPPAPTPELEWADRIRALVRPDGSADSTAAGDSTRRDSAADDAAADGAAAGEPGGATR